MCYNEWSIFLNYIFYLWDIYVYFISLFDFTFLKLITFSFRQSNREGKERDAKSHISHKKRRDFFQFLFPYVEREIFFQFLFSHGKREEIVLSFFFSTITLLFDNNTIELFLLISIAKRCNFDFITKFTFANLSDFNTVSSTKTSF